MALAPTRREHHAGHHRKPRFPHEGGGVSWFPPGTVGSRRPIRLPGILAFETEVSAIGTAAIRKPGDTLRKRASPIPKGHRSGGSRFSAGLENAQRRGGYHRCPTPKRELPNTVIHDVPVETSRVAIGIGIEKTTVSTIAGRWALALQPAKTRRKDCVRPTAAYTLKMTPVAMATVPPSGPAPLRRTRRRPSGSHGCPACVPTPIGLLQRPTCGL